MTDTTALRALRDKVAAGESFGDMPRPYALHTDLVWKAFSGSLDAAKALHENLLPGWGWTLGRARPDNWFAKVWSAAKHHDSAIADNPARAWLLAILDALIQGAEG